jgi:hypothetical protein
MIFILLIFPSFFFLYENGLSHFEIAPLFILSLPLIILFYLNKPKANDIQLRFWYSKWKLTIFIVISILTIGTLYNIPPIKELYHFHYVIYNYPLPIGFLVTVGPVFHLVIAIVKKIWICPACSKPLKIATIGKSKNVGFNIQVCPHCDEQLVKA